MIGISDEGGLCVWDIDWDYTEEESVICDRGLLEGVIGVTLRVCVVVVVVWDSELECRLEAEGVVSDEESRFIVWWNRTKFSLGYVCVVSVWPISFGEMVPS